MGLDLMFYKSEIRLENEKELDEHGVFIGSLGNKGWEIAHNIMSNGMQVDEDFYEIDGFYEVFNVSALDYDLEVLEVIKKIFEECYYAYIEEDCYIYVIVSY